MRVELDYSYRAARNAMMEHKLEQIRRDGQWRTPRSFDNERAFRVGFTVEAAWAQHHGAPYAIRDYTFGCDDVLGYQLRGTQHTNGHLTTYDRDPRAIYILGIVDSECTTVEFVGWTTKRLANKPERLRDCWPNGQKMHEPAYCAAQSELYDLDMIPATDQLIAHRSVKV